MTPEISLIKVKKEHVPSDKYPTIQSSLFNKECFGSLYLEGSKEIDLSLISLFEESSFRDKLSNREDYLKIALFDIWIANEDRNHNNFNLLLFVAPNKMNFFYAIDHVNIFNSSYLNYGIADLTEDDSLIKTELAKILFKNSKKLTQIVDSLVENFYLLIQECYNNLDKIIALTPNSWGIEKEEVKGKIVQNLFTEEWAKRCERNFREFIQSFIIN